MFHFKLELEDGTPADPQTVTVAVPNWHAGDTIPLGAGRSLRVVVVREGVLVVTEGHAVRSCSETGAARSLP